MDQFIDTLIDIEIGALNDLISAWRISDDIFEECGTSFFMNQILLNPNVGSGASKDLPNYEMLQQRLCRAAPHVSPNAIAAVSMVYVGLTALLDEGRIDGGSSVENSIKLLMTASYIRGLAEGSTKDSLDDFEAALARAKSELARIAAGKSHTMNRAMKADVFQWLDSQSKFKSNEAAAMAITKQQPIQHVTARDWYKEWKKLRSASTP